MSTPPASPKPPLASALFEWAQLKVIPTRVGERRDFFDAPTKTFRNLECHATTLNAGEVPHESHRHPDEELIIVKEGLLEATINGRASVGGPGSIFFFASNDEHGLRNAHSGQTSYHVLRMLTAETPPA